MSGDDPNELGAKLIKAELMGDQELIESLKARLEKARAAQAQSGGNNNNNNNKSGNYGSSNSGHRSYQHGGQNNRYQDRHSNHRHYQDRQNSSKGASGGGGGGGNYKNRDPAVSEILKRTYKHSSVEEEYEELATTRKKMDVVENTKRFKRMFSNEDEKQDQEKSDKSAASSKSSSSSKKPLGSDNCRFCFENMQKHLVASIGKHCYLSLPSTESLVEGHCYLIPMNHCSSSVLCDEDVHAEILEYKKSLVSMFDQRNRECVFIEQYGPTDRQYSHLVIECIPLDKSVSNMAPIYFKKAIVESENEWSAQNKSLIQLSQEKQLRKAVPNHMPYFSVEFGLFEGYVHVIENNESFPDHFGLETIGGILDLDPFLWRRPRQDEFAEQSKKVIEFIKWWKPFDFTKK